jgi:hypothetical protein
MRGDSLHDSSEKRAQCGFDVAALRHSEKRAEELRAPALAIALGVVARWRDVVGGLLLRAVRAVPCVR